MCNCVTERLERNVHKHTPRNKNISGKDKSLTYILYAVLQSVFASLSAQSTLVV